MRDLLLDTRSVLESGSYRTQTPEGRSDCLYFEDATILGAVYFCPSVQIMLANWEREQDSFLRSNTTRFSIDPLKAWNSYSIFLTDGVATSEQKTQLFAAEEDFRGTRKILRCSVESRSDIENAIASLLPLRRIVELSVEDIRERLMDRLKSTRAPLHSLLTDATPSTIAQLLVNEP